MIGAIIGDIIGSAYEFNPIKTRDFPLLSPACGYTDDTLMTLAVARALMRSPAADEELREGFVREMRRIGRAYPHPMGGYGSGFSRWLASPRPAPYRSFGNGAAMRVSPCGECAATLEEALALAKLSAEVTHNHPEGIKGAQAVAAAVYLAGRGESKAEIRRVIRARFYPLTQSLAQLRPRCGFDESCQGTVPQALTAFLEADDFEDAARNAVSLGGDSDTLADIACAVAWPFYARAGESEAMQALRLRALALLPEALRTIATQWEAFAAGRASGEAIDKLCGKD